MATNITINGTSFPLPGQGDSPPWGDSLDNIITALVAVVNTLSGTSDILNTSFTVANNISSATNVTGLNFDTTLVRSAIVTYSIYRSSSTPTELVETGFMLLGYLSTANTWELIRYSQGDAGVTFTVTTTGQVKYTSSEAGSTSYVGKLKFSAKTFLQA